MYLTLCSFCLALMLSCAGQAGGGRKVSEGHEFKLKVGQEASLKGERLKVRFDSVAEDSRCPEGVVCVWAGNARVSLVLEQAGGARSTLELNTNVEPKAAAAEGFEVRLTNLSPYPRADARLDPKQYVVTLVVGRKR